MALEPGAAGEPSSIAICMANSHLMSRNGPRRLSKVPILSLSDFIKPRSWRLIVLKFIEYSQHLWSLAISAVGAGGDGGLL